MGLCSQWLFATDDVAVKRIAWYVWRANGNCELKDVGLNYTFSDITLVEGDIIEVKVYDPAGLANKLPAGRTATCGTDSFKFYIR